MTRSATPRAADPNWPLHQEEWTCTQIAAATEYTDRQIRRLCEDGVLRARTTPGGHYRVAAEDLYEYLNGERPSDGERAVGSLPVRSLPVRRAA